MNRTISLCSTATLFHADCRDAMRALPDNCIDAVVTDPPYAINFMGRHWDVGDVAFDVTFWSEVLRVLKPGGHIAAFGATRQYHRMACAIEDAGFEIRDSLMFLYGTGFPKSLDVSKAIDKAAAQEWAGFGTALKPASEPIVLARKPLSEPTVAANVLRWRTGALNIDGCRIAGEGNKTFARGTGDRDREQYRTGTTFGSAIPTDLGRWPANVVHDGSDEVIGAFPNAPGQLAKVGPEHGAKTSVNCYGDYGPRQNFEPRVDQSKSAARFFYSAKASKADRAGSKHPTVKPIALMQWLSRLITPPGGVILDPFAGSGTTGAAAMLEGFNVVLCEREQEYVDDICARFSSPGLVS